MIKFKNKKEEKEILSAILQKLDHLDKHFDKITRLVLENNVYTENMPLLIRLSSFKEFIKLGGNGNCKNYAMSNLILQNKELWQSIVDAKNSPEIVQEEENYYTNTLSEIKKVILS